MRIMIVGHTSMVGRHLAEAAPCGHVMYRAGRRGGADVKLDFLADHNQFSDVPVCDAIVNCAASFEPDTLAGAELNERVNSQGAFVVARLAEAASCPHIVNLSSIFVYNHPDNQYYGSYGMSKAHGEDNLSLCCRISGFKFTSLRLAQIYDDAGESRRHQPFLYQIIDNAREGRETVFWGAQDRLRNFIHVDDVCTVIMKTLETGAEGLHPVMFPESHKVSEIAGMAYKVFGKEPAIRFIADKPDVKSIYLPPMSDLFQRIGFTPRLDLGEGIARIRSHLNE